MKIISAKDVSFKQDEHSQLSCITNDGKSYSPVHCVSLFPLSLPEKYISVFTEKNQEIEEIGIINDLTEFNEEQRNIILEAIKERYFVPEIIDIKDVSTKYGGRKKTGICEVTVFTDRGQKTIHIFNPRENISLHSNGAIMITDIQQNRYKITKIENLSEKARRNLDLIML